jgi:hypothetical protein
LEADELSFRARPPGLMDVYGAPAKTPHVLRFRARPKTSPRPAPRPVRLLHATEAPQVDIAYDEGEGWLSVTPSRDVLLVAVNAQKLVDRHGRYRARVTAGPETFGVELEVPAERPRTSVVVDDLDPGCEATPGFWLRPRFSAHHPARWKPGHGGTYLVNGGRNDEDAVVRFTPDLAAGSYVVSFPETTPFRLFEGAPEDLRFAVRVRHRSGTDLVWVEPHKSRAIGTFDFAEGSDGWVEILARDSRGQVVADAVRFERR